MCVHRMGGGGGADGKRHREEGAPGQLRALECQAVGVRFIAVNEEQSRE